VRIIAVVCFVQMMQYICRPQSVTQDFIIFLKSFFTFNRTGTFLNVSDQSFLHEWTRLSKRTCILINVHININISRSCVRFDKITFLRSLEVSFIYKRIIFYYLQIARCSALLRDPPPYRCSFPEHTSMDALVSPITYRCHWKLHSHARMLLCNDMTKQC